MGRMEKITPINSSQIFVIYEPAMFGTFICNLLLQNKKTNKLLSDSQGYNAHKSEYKDRLKNFHNHRDAMALSGKNDLEKINFFKSLSKYNYSVHRLCSYAFLQLNFDKFFNNYVKIIIRPKTSKLMMYAERFVQTTKDNDYRKQFWAKNFRNKNIDTVPLYFTHGMAVKECKKYLQEHSKYLKNYNANKVNDIFFDPDNIANFDMLQNLIKNAMSKVNLQPNKLPLKEVKQFIQINKKFLP